MLLLVAILTLRAGLADDDFRSIHEFQCDFTEAAARTYPEDGGAAIKTDTDLVKDLRFDRIDYPLKRARVTAGSGGTGTDVTVVAGVRGTSFFGFSVDRNPMMTTIFRRPRPRDGVPNGRYFAVMSRHNPTENGPSLASQLYGTCRAIRP